MIRKYLSLVVCCLSLIAANSSFVSAQSRTENNDSSTAKIKAKVVKRSSAKNKYIKVKMLDGKRLSGDVAEAGADSFTLTDSKTKQSIAIAYRDVAQVKGKGLSTASIIAIGGLTAAAAIVLTVVLLPICNEGGC